MNKNINDIKLTYILSHEKYKHISHGQIIYHYVVLIFIGIISLLALLTKLLERLSMVRLNVFNSELVALILLFPTVLTFLWIIYYCRMIKYRSRLVLLRDDLLTNGQLVCYDANEKYPQTVYIKSDAELGDVCKPIDYSEKCFDEYDRVFRLKNKLF